MKAQLFNNALFETGAIENYFSTTNPNITLPGTFVCSEIRGNKEGNKQRHCYSLGLNYFYTDWEGLTK